MMHLWLLRKGTHLDALQPACPSLPFLNGPRLPQGLAKMKDLLQKNIQTGVEFANKA